MITTLADRARALASLFWRELAKFGAVGGVAFVIDKGLFWLLIHGPMADSEVKAQVLSASIATVFSWIANRYWTFRHRRRANLVHELLMFLLINAIGMGIAAGFVWLAKYPLEISDRPGRPTRSPARAAASRSSSVMMGRGPTVTNTGTSSTARASASHEAPVTSDVSPRGPS